MIECPYRIGDRQTVDCVKHPTLGEGRLVHRNGPAFFIADSGEWRDLTRVDGDSAQENGRHVEFDTRGRQCGARHDRVYVHTRGGGWLVWLIDNDCHHHRFEPDGGLALDMRADVLWSGLPEHKDCWQKDVTKQMAARAAGWRSMCDAMTTLTWCHEADKEKAIAHLEHRNDPKPEKPKCGKKRAPRGPFPDFANMTRGQIQAWERGSA